MILNSQKIDTEEVLLETETHQRVEKPLETNRLSWFLGISFLGIALLFGRIFYLQLIKGGYYETVAKDNQTQTTLIKAPRGVIFGRYFEPLAENIIDDTSSLRFYNFSEATSHLIGYVDQEGSARTGLEAYYNDFLKGKDGYIKTEHSSKKNEERLISRKESEVGKNLLLHTNLALQEKIFNFLPADKKSAAVVLDPSNGGVLALVSKPSFDGNIFTDFISEKDYSSLINDPLKPLFNRAVSGQYPPGSIWKIFLAVAALEEDLLDPFQKQTTPKKISIKNKYDPNVIYVFPDWKDHGKIDMFDALRQSSNVYFYRLGELLGWKNLQKYAKKFGFGEKLGLDIAGESQGFIPKRGWLGDLYHSSIGQGEVKVTPLQVAVATAAIKSSKLYQPQIVDKIIDENNQSIKDILPKVLNNELASPETLELVKMGMDSYQWQVFGLPVKIYGKTGTAQFAPNVNKYHSWFTSFTDDIVVVILVEEGEGGVQTALPIAKKIYEWYYQNNKLIKQ